MSGGGFTYTYFVDTSYCWSQEGTKMQEVLKRFYHLRSGLYFCMWMNKQAQTYLGLMFAIPECL